MIKKPVTGPDGIRYESGAAMSRAYGLDPALVAGRLHNGWSPAEALNIPVNAHFNVVTYKGVTYPSLREAARALGLNINVVYSRYRKGLLIEDVLAPTPTPRRRVIKDHTGRVFKNTTEMCRHWGIPLIRFRNRVNHGKWSLEEALTTGKRVQIHASPNRKGIACADHKGRTFESYKAMCRYWHIPYMTFMNRRKNGWSLKSALTLNPTPLSKVRPKKPLSYIWDDELGRYVR